MTWRVGFVIGNQLREIRVLHPDRPGGGALGTMRFGWVAEAVNRTAGGRLLYELHRPWRRYDALVFLKAMGGRNAALRDRYMRKGRKVVFDANVNYYEEGGQAHFEGMDASPEQRKDAIEMTGRCDGVIADSSYLANVCGRYNPKVCWIPDNVRMEEVPPYRPWRPDSGPLSLLWCGQAHKMFELLVIEDVLRKFGKRVRLVLVTNDLGATGCWKPELKARFDRFLGDVPSTIVRFESITRLLALYSETGGAAVSPRFLDHPYNLGHTEWKISLAMACGRIAVCSPAPSYCDVARRAGGDGIRVCPGLEEWEAAIDGMLAGKVDFDVEGRAARAVVERHYSTSVVAAAHAAFMTGILEGCPAGSTTVAAGSVR